MNDLGTPTPLPPFIPPNTIQHVTISLTVAESIQYEPSQTHTSLALQPKLSIRVMPVVIHSNKQTNKPTKPHFPITIP
ncbi:uncharacterized protein EAE97_005475 [Botrytis byssoidea]|uniref:Uncharacterized protein n=1 Tax=Botrytis byssoidea TaxID=139641 RepID=A0A9P5IKK0_9HELO|nr:uncharacterized protein EAE97_005475 [Botrytis byssoidea]KAF7944842.1 hypothetical protein EAE97_005475 [Botrytis byssoidea]